MYTTCDGWRDDYWTVTNRASLVGVRWDAGYRRDGMQIASLVGVRWEVL